MLKRCILILGVLGVAIFGLTQDEIEPLEKKLDDSYGTEKLVILNELIEHHLQFDDRKSLKYGKQAVDLAESLFQESEDSIVDHLYYLKVDAYNLLGLAHFNKDHYYDAQLSFQTANSYAQKIKYVSGVWLSNEYLGKLDSIGVKSNVLKEKWSDLKLGRAIKAESQDLAIASTLKTAEMNESNGNYEKAIKNYEQAINYLKDKGDEEQIAELYRKIAENYKNIGNIAKSLEYYKLAIGEKERLGDTTGVVDSKESISQIQNQIVELIETKPYIVDSAEIMVELKTREDYRNMAIELEASEDFEQSLQYYKLYTELNDKIIEDEKIQELALLEKSYQIERNLQEIQLLTQDKEIQDLELLKRENEIKEQNRFRKNLTFGIVLLLTLAGALYWLYVSKRRDHKRLNVAHKDLQSTQNKLIDAEKKIKTLLDQQVSTAVAKELLSENFEGKIQRKSVCIMFLDIRGFTPFAESRKPEEIIQYQNEVFGFMIDSVYRHHGIINQFLGDGFMATFGAPVSTGNDSENAFLAAREIIQTVNDKSKNGEIPETKVGIGLHTGRVVAGNVGTDLRKQYSVTGNAVIIAARIEQLNKKYGSQLLVSEDVIQNMNSENLEYESLGEVQLKGREKPINIIKVL